MFNGLVPKWTTLNPGRTETPLPGGSRDREKDLAENLAYKGVIEGHRNETMAEIDVPGPFMPSSRTFRMGENAYYNYTQECRSGCLCFNSCGNPIVS